MPIRQIAGALVLALLVATFGGIVYKRGFGFWLGAKPSSVETLYSTEEGWIVAEIVRDITEMSVYPESPAASPTVSPVEVGLYQVSIPGAPADVRDLDLRQDLWAPEKFAIVADVALATRSAGTGPASRDMAPINGALGDLTPASLVATSASISQALRANIRDARAHEAAALTLGAFALREAAGRSYDARWAMNRMTAHLAMAAALRKMETPTHANIDALLADAVLQTLKNRQTHALTLLDALDRSDRSPAVSAWTRALRVRITQDWRTIPNPSTAITIEKFEYFRARRATVTNTRGAVELHELSVDLTAQWLRVMEAYSMGVQDASLVKQAMDLERAEYSEVFQRMHGHAIPSDDDANEDDRDGDVKVLNARATRAIGNAGPEVLPWGAWAEFAQRHLGMHIGWMDTYYRHSLDDPEGADTEKALLSRQWGGLSMFPIATLWWTKGPAGSEADLRYINEAIDVALAQPERLTAMEWAFLENGTRYEPVRRGMPSPRTWFVQPAARAAYDAGARVKDSGHPHVAADLASIMQEAPYDFRLAEQYLLAKSGGNAQHDEVSAAYAPRLEYDLRALRLARNLLPAGDERLGLFRRSCDISPPECLALGWELAQADHASEAAQVYEQAFADPSVDAVALANNSGWLVDYYHRRGRTRVALELAGRSAQTGAFQGLVTAAHLFERLDQWNDAEQLYSRAASRYQNPSQLLGFYYRAVTLRKQAQFEMAWKTSLEPVFPNGLVAGSLDDTKPARGVIVTKDNQKVRKAGLQAGDIIIGLEGWRVEDLPQYRAINAFFEHDQMKLAVWRGKAFTVDITATNRLMGIEFRTYPIEGWGER